jgi:hypothetical protein
MAGSPLKTARRLRWLAMREKPETLESILECVAEGGSLAAWCTVHDVAYRSVHEWITQPGTDRALAFEAAKRAKAQALVEQIDATATKVESGELRPDVGRTVIETKRWLAQVHDRAQFGERVQVDAKVEHTHKLHLDALMRLRAQRLAPQGSAPALAHDALHRLGQESNQNKDLQVIEGTVVPKAEDL